jgi:hypothetical protein
MTKRKKRWIWGSIVAFVLLMIIAGSGDREGSSSSRSEPTSAASSQKAKPKADLELLDASGAIKPFTTEITGRIRNNRSRKYRYAQVTFNVFDSKDQQVGTALANINGLEPGAVWKFKAVYMGSEGSKYRLDEITGY